MSKKITLFSLLAALVLVSCQEPGITQPDPASGDPETSVPQEAGTSIYYVDDAFGDPSGPGDVPPETYIIVPTVSWGSNTNGQIVATGSVYAHFDTDFGDKDQPANSYAKVQIMLVKNGQIFDGHTTSIPIAYASDNGAIVDNRTQEEYVTKSASHTFTFDFEDIDDLEGVSIVAQGLLMGCFAWNYQDERVGIYYADDEREVFSLPAPGAPTNLSYTDTFGINLSWNAGNFAEYYRIYRKVDSNPWELEGTSTGTTYHDEEVIKLPDLHTIQYRIQAVNPSGSSIYSNVVSTQGNLPGY